MLPDGEDGGDDASVGFRQCRTRPANRELIWQFPGPGCAFQKVCARSDLLHFLSTFVFGAPVSILVGLSRTTCLSEIDLTSSGEACRHSALGHNVPLGLAVIQGST